MVAPTAALAIALSGGALAGCAGPADEQQAVARARPGATSTPPRAASGAPTAPPASTLTSPDLSLQWSPPPASPAVAPLTRRVPPTALVTANRPLTGRELAPLRAAATATAVIGYGAVTLGGQSLTVAAVDPSTYRVLAPAGTAESDPLWQAVARGEATVAHSVAEQLHLRLGGTTRLGSQTVRLGAFATTVPGVDVVVDQALGRRLGVPADTAVVAAGDPAALTAALRGVAGVRVEQLGDWTRAWGKTAGDPADRQAFLTGDAAAARFGTFRYHQVGGGRIEIDKSFVAAYIRTEQVPILGEVTCHKLMFPQLRAALQEVVASGLADEIHPSQYGGCFVPKMIEGSDAVSLHSWGIAIDLNVAENQRGTPGKIDRRVVAIFQKWGFVWGGVWHWTDPMHFELGGLLTGAD